MINYRHRGVVIIIFLLFSVAGYNQNNILENGISRLTVAGGTIVGGQINIIGNGSFLNRRAYVPSETTLDEIDLIFGVKVISTDTNGVFRFGIGKQATIAGTMVEFFGTDTASYINVHKMNGTVLDFIHQFVLPFNFTIGSEYTFRVSKKIRTLEIEVVSDSVYFYNDSLSYPSPFFGCLWGRPFISCHTGEISINSFVLATPLNKMPRLAVWGDSFIEGNSLENVEDRYVSLIKDSIGYHNITIMGRGGESSGTLSSRFTRETQWINSKYALLAIGVNDNNFTVWKNNTQKWLDTLKKKNMIPIIATLTPRYDRLAFINQVNSWIATTYGGAYVNLNAAVSDDGLIWNTGYAMTDNIHPTPFGHLEMLRRIRTEAPYIFRDSSAFTIDFINETTFQNLADTMEYATSSNFISSTLGTNAPAVVIPATTLYFRDTMVTPGYHIIYDILNVPKRPNPPTPPPINNTGGLYDWVFNPAFPQVEDYEFSVDSGFTWTVCYEKPIQNYSLSEVRVRVKATTVNFKSEQLYLYDSTEVITSTEALAENSLKIYPNPFKDRFVVDKVNEKTELIVYAVDGREVKKLALMNNTTVVDMSECVPGFYIVVLKNSSYQRVFNVVKE